MGAQVMDQSLKRSLAIIRQGTALDSFRPNTGGQELIARSKAHELIIAGGNSSGKTYISVIKTAWHILPEKDKNGNLTGKTIHPYMELRIPTAGIEGWISTWSQDSQRDTLRPVIDKILGPHIKDYVLEDGVFKRLFFEGVKERSWINFKWQTQGAAAYRGPKKAFVYLDEPHSQTIYRESMARLFRSGGYMWTALTPVIDHDSPMKARDVIWMRDLVVEPYERHPEKYPLREVIYMDVDENAAHIDIEMVDSFLDGMSAGERAIRKSGLFILFAGRNCFQKEMLTALMTYVMENPEETTPEYGTLEYSPVEDDVWKVEFTSDQRIEFPDKPQNEWAIKIWERHIEAEGLQGCPGYTIAVDVAEGKMGGDYTSAYVFRNDSRRVVGALHGHITEEALAGQLWLLGHYYNSGAPDYEPALLAIEVRNFGAAAQRYLIHGSKELQIPKYPFHRLYQRPSTSDLAQGRQYAMAPGWDTNSKTRTFVITAMRQAIVLAFRAIQNGKKIPIPDMGCLKEAREFVMNKQGKYSGDPDDRLFSLGIGHSVIGHDPFMYDMNLPEDEEPIFVNKNVAFYLRKAESGMYVPQFNHGAVIDEIMNTDANKLVF